MLSLFFLKLESYFPQRFPFDFNTNFIKNFSSLRAVIVFTFVIVSVGQQG
ncbi:hypothetical protein [uncultured Gammaproteobacteria bacterium]|nr:hypothetical protein [uncultured Gammaproteobacteria bacterium]